MLALAAATDVELRCIDCGTPCGGACPGCGRAYPVHDGLLRACGELTGKNRIAAEFYNSDRWQRFRPWEQLFLKFNGGVPGARKQALRHVAGSRRLLEVGIGNGENVALLPPPVEVTGIDIAERPLGECRDRFPDRGLVLALAEAEQIPFPDWAFDAVLCVGGFNFFSDPETALREMARVTRPGGRVVVADEVPDLFERGWGHLLGWPALDRWLMERFWFGPEFTAMAVANKLDVAAVAAAVLGGFRLRTIWRGLGYCLVADV